MDLLENNLSTSAVVNVKKWLTEPKYAEYKEELEQLIENQNWKELEDSFFKVLEFGTAGRRGSTGVGSNRVNRVTVGESAQALCMYAKQFSDEATQKGIVIACDTRLSSPELSQYTAQVCAANGFKTFIFDSCRATPELSFAVRHLGCAAGIVISASHNPPEDNGFKAYWSDGAQLVEPHASGVLEMATQIDEVFAVEDFDAAVQAGQIEVIGKDVDEAYFEAVLEQSEGTERGLKIVYSPLHGAGQTNVLPVLKMAGFSDIITVDEQMVPDGNFPTVKNFKPNPEEKAANDMAVEAMLKYQADIAITNDPDADRLGVMVQHQGEAVYLNGNQVATLVTDYSLRKLQEKGELTDRHYIIKTIVTTDMMNALADKYGATIYDNLLIGFKYIGEVVRKKETTDEIFVMGAEESYGALKGDYARDKDGASATLAIVEYAAELKQEGKTLLDKLMDLYSEVGLFIENTEVLAYPGAEGFVTMQKIMSSFRDNPPVKIGTYDVTATLDYKTLKKSNADGYVEDIDCESGNVLVLEFGDRKRRVAVRPSGTEPKLKLYIQWYQETDNPQEDYQKLLSEIKNLYSDLSAEALKRA